ncbi:MAG: insulinase family protein [Synechococcus sp. SB0673_bin_10]|uniref:Insulinase family protein n=1 Tax=Synechococcus sp. SB0676_bin_10 TaxID=2604869 RepID=A0A6B1FCW2_9SYNE|nr:insulinase family protein [Synechococcus sp. SB0667_bin_8]MXY18720.1 insulinase family protein [Synechococcus sp. SB0664_bin_36]MYF36608.1 insulinase family protein [Synechococcus sp. SB0678_bin_12]MYG38823.1 insulinase family protein [Synechococcus sp. SB0676_bin_10]MYG63124.1 insulinase family protein [Synechococcus sp. SB0675_bin_7]MYI72445.1 insulinase family protein [Synechococcus sp. SB0673_bin_10]MYI87600.1 insulinase family protein [Synechococcus sp. SB0672_bin_10]MYK06557.1 insul
MRLDLHHRHQRIELLVQQRRHVGVMALCWWIAGGSAADPPGQRGQAHLLAGAIQRGTVRQDAVALAEELESRGAYFAAGAREDGVVLCLGCMAADAAPLLDRVREMVQTPRLAPREVRREQQLTLQALDQQREDPLQLALADLRRLLYGPGGYGHAPLGLKKAEVAALTPSQLRRAHQGWGSSAMVIAAAGHLDQGTTARLTALAEDLIPSHGSTPVAQAAALPTPATMAFHPQDTEQVVLLLGAATCGLNHQDQAVLRLLQCHLSTGMSARLPQVIRETHGLAYEVGVLFPVRQQSAPFIVYLSTSRDRAALALELLLTEWRRLLETPLQPEELCLARAKLQGQELAALQTSGQVAERLALLRGYGMAVDAAEQQLAQLTQRDGADCQRVARRWLSQPRLAAVGPQALAAPLEHIWSQTTGST